MEDKKSVDRRNIAAILLILAGGLLFLETFDVVDINLKYYIFSWKTLMIAIGVIIVVSSEQRLTGYILMGAGLLFWLPSFASYNVSLHQVFWPLVLIAIGLIIITRRHKHDSSGRGRRQVAGEDGSFPTDYIDDVSIFGGGIKRYSSQNLKGGNVTAIFGGSEIDLTTAQLSSEGTVVDLFTMFGGTKFIIPGSWQVKSEATSLFGGFSDKRHIKPDQAVTDKVFLIKGVVFFGGVEIKSY